MKRVLALALACAMIFVMAATAAVGDDAAMTRADYVKQLVTMAKVNPLLYSGSFTDVTASDSFSDVLEGALNAGIVDKAMTVNGAFDPNGALTREAAVAMAVKALRAMKASLSVGSDLTYTDAAEIAPWAVTYVEVALANGVIQPSAAFGPRDVLSVPEAEAFLQEVSALYRTLPLLPGSGIMRQQFPTLTVPDGVTRPAAIDESYNLVFDDEFDGTTLDTTKWRYNYSWGHSHNHGAWCIEENVRLEDGKLVLVGEDKQHPDAVGKQGTFNNQKYDIIYTSGAVNTHHVWNFNYGYFEGRFKMPKGKGLWPAFWMLKDGWPPEIDMFEILCSKPTQVLTNYHYGPSWNNTGSFYNVNDVGVDITDDFHTYGYLWTPNKMEWYFDNKQIAKTYTDKSRIAESNGMYMIINLAIRGWDGDPDETTVWPARFECDWVRVWQANE